MKTDNAKDEYLEQLAEPNPNSFISFYISFGYYFSAAFVEVIDNFNY